MSCTAAITVCTKALLSLQSPPVSTKPTGAGQMVWLMLALPRPSPSRSW
jgi:hypothetical protein